MQQRLWRLWNWIAIKKHFVETKRECRAPHTDYYYHVLPSRTSILSAAEVKFPGHVTYPL